MPQNMSGSMFVSRTRREMRAQVPHNMLGRMLGFVSQKEGNEAANGECACMAGGNLQTCATKASVTFEPPRTKRPMLTRHGHAGQGQVEAQECEPTH